MTAIECQNCGHELHQDGHCYGCPHGWGEGCGCTLCRTGGKDRGANYEREFREEIDDADLNIEVRGDESVMIWADGMTLFTKETWQEIVEFVRDRQERVRQFPGEKDER